MARTAFHLGHRVLYHWQRFDAKDAALKRRLMAFLATNKLYCSSPGGLQ
jgi:hypothetical protein